MFRPCLMMAAAVLSVPLLADDNSSACRDLPSQSALQAALKSARGMMNGGFNLDMWATVVNRDGVVCALAFTGTDRGSQWPGSRVISAQKANTANAFSLPNLALSIADLYSAVQPGGSLYGLQHSNPVDTGVAYGGNSSNYGQPNDPMVGGLGVGGDSSCADHNIAWRTRHTLLLDYVPGGVGPDPTRADNIVYDIMTPVGFPAGVSSSGWGHPECSPAAKTISLSLVVTREQYQSRGITM
jgi:uncharacterized protein GlcG (DUF336 family)